MARKVLLWFRQDLRLQDNPALQAAAAYANQSGAKIVPVYILDDHNPEQWKMGAASRVWLHHSLQSLKSSLDSSLFCFSGDASQIVESLVEALDIEAVFWNRCYEPWRIKRDKSIKASLFKKNIEVYTYNGSLLWEPWDVLKKDQTPYKVFTPYYKRGCLQRALPRFPFDTKKVDDLPLLKKPFRNRGVKPLSIDAFGLLPGLYWYQNVIGHWKVGEHAAKEKLGSFLKNNVSVYGKGRDFPAEESCSRLSPHLHFGEISPHQIWYAALPASGTENSEGLEKFRSEIAWREFSYYLLYHWPTITDKEFNSRFKSFPWQQDVKALVSWQRGLTGYPLVDAGMRELWQTGTMHNRVRMIVASFLVKNQMINWREGERWFWDCLFDADLASNSASWQWVAGSGADAAPYFRIFNPVTQSEKFDPEGEYIRKYCPELAGLNKKMIHQPWKASEAELEEANIILGETYPKPVLDLKQTRNRALEAYKSLAG